MTNRIFSRLLSLAAALVVLPGLSACHSDDPGSEPEPDQPTSVALTLQFDIASGFTDFEATRNEPDPYPLLLRACIYREAEPKPVHTPVVSFDLADYRNATSLSQPVELVPGTYTVLAWAHYGELWDAGDLDCIALRSEGFFNEFSLSYQCRERFTVTQESEGAAFTMTPPMARLSIVAADRAAAQGHFYSRIRYTQFYPTAFSLFSNEPVDSASGVELNCYEFTPVPNSDDVEIGADYILVNGHETSIPLRFEILDAAGEVVKGYDISAPLLRGRQTTVRGNFFTGESSAGTTIDPSFDGEDYFIEF